MLMMMPILFLFLLCFLCQLSAIQSTNVNSTVTLECQLKTAGIIRWHYFGLRDGIGKAVILYNGARLAPRYNSTGRFSVNCTSSRRAVCSLTIQPVHFHDGGDYSCFTPSYVRSSQDFQLIVIGGTLECDSGVSLDTLTESDVIKLHCHVNYDNYPVYIHFNCSTEPQTMVESGHIHRNVSTNKLTALITTYYSQQVRVNRRLNGGRVMCTVQFIRYHDVIYTSNWTSPSMTVAYNPREVSIGRSAPERAWLEDGDVVTCTADSNPPATYEWTELITGVHLHKGAELVVDACRMFSVNMWNVTQRKVLLRCAATANNHSDFSNITTTLHVNKLCTDITTSRQYVIQYVIDPRTARLIAGCTVIVAVLLLAIIISIVFAYKRLGTNASRSINARLTQEPAIEENETTRRPTSFDASEDGGRYIEMDTISADTTYGHLDPATRERPRSPPVYDRLTRVRRV